MLHATIELARRIERAEIDFCALAGAQGTYGRVASLDVGGGRALFSRAGSPLNKVLGLGLQGPVSDSELDRLEAFYASRRSLAQVEDLRVRGNLRFAELRDPLLVEHARHRVHALHSAAVHEHLHSAGVEQPHRAGAGRRVLRTLRQRGSVAVAPSEKPHALVESDLLPQLQFAGGQPERCAAGVSGGLRVAEQLQRSAEAPQRLRTARDQRGCGAKR